MLYQSFIALFTKPTVFDCTCPEERSKQRLCCCPWMGAGAGEEKQRHTQDNLASHCGEGERQEKDGTHGLDREKLELISLRDTCVVRTLGDGPLEITGGEVTFPKNKFLQRNLSKKIPASCCTFKKYSCTENSPLPHPLLMVSPFIALGLLSVLRVPSSSIFSNKGSK